ncbi:MAG: OmpA family protein [Phaeodactylibacter sp.]|nr:OmpA family protein [Phaeodactylibacter sp.]
MSSLEAHMEQKRKANRIVRFRTVLAAGVGFIPFPAVDAAGILAIQLWMLRDLAGLYDVPFKKQLAQSIIGSLVGNIGTVGAVKLIPGLGSLLGGGAVAVSGGAATYALGKIFTQHFSQGGTLLTFDPVKSQQYFQQLYEEGKASLQEQEMGLQHARSQALASVSTLKETNEELKSTIAFLQQQLEEGKQAVSKEKKKRRFRWLWIVLFLAVVGVVAVLLYRTGYFAGTTGAEADVENAAAEPAKPAPEAGESVDASLTEASPPDTSSVETAGPGAAELGFAEETTEALMADYLSAPDSALPKTFTLDAVQFQEGDVGLPDEAQPQIDNIALLLLNYPAATVRIYGHSDQLGGKAANRQAGRNRARAIQEALEQNGVARNRISVTYLEKEAPPEGIRGADIEIGSR